MAASNLFNEVDDGEDDLFNEDKVPSMTTETGDSTNGSGLFNPSKAKESLFELDDDDSDDSEPSQQQYVVNDDKLLFNEEDVDNNTGEEPLGFLNNDDNDGENEETDGQFEVIDPTEAPSVEEAEQQLEIVRQEIERRKREEQEEEKEEGITDEQEGPDGGLLSRVTGTFSPTNPDRTSPCDPDDNEDVLDEETDPQSKDEIIRELQQQVSQLSTNLQSAQSENQGLRSETDNLRQQLNEAEEKISDLDETIKMKDAEIATLQKEIPPRSPSKSSSKPSPSPKKPSLLAGSKQITSPKQKSARLKQDIEKKSVAETVKKFGDTKKTSSPATKKSTLTKKDSAEKLTESSRVPRQDSTSSRKKDPAGSGSPTKPARTKPRSGSQTKSDDISSPMISGKPQRNTLDAIKLWEQKTGDKEEAAAPTKKPLANVKSTPCVKSDENGEENVPPALTEDVAETDSSHDLDVKEKELTEQKSPLRQGNKESARQKKTESMVVSGSKSKRWGPPTPDKCQVCNKSVYPTERLQADEKVYHKTCFRCTHCKKVVGLGNYAALQGDIFCKTHFKQLFRMKGNYDEGFGREQHKKKWSKSALQEDDTATTSED